MDLMMIFRLGKCWGFMGPVNPQISSNFRGFPCHLTIFITCHLLYKSCFIKDRSRDFRGNQKPWHLAAICGFPLKPFCHPKKIDLKPGTKCEQMGKMCHVLIMAWFIWIRGQPGRGKFADDGSVLTFVSVMICSKWFLASGVQKSA